LACLTSPTTQVNLLKVYVVDKLVVRRVYLPLSIVVPPMPHTHSSICRVRKKRAHLEKSSFTEILTHTNMTIKEQDRQCKYKFNISVLPYDHFCNGKAINITRCGCGCVNLVIQHAVRMRHIGIYGLPHSTIFFFNYVLNSTIFEKKSS